MAAFILMTLTSIAMLGWGAHELHHGLISRQMDLIAWAAFKFGVGLINGFIAAILYLIRELKNRS